MSKVSRWLFCPFVLDAMLAPAALGCGADPLAALHGPGFEDNFKKPAPLWSVDGKSAYFADGQLVLKPDAGRRRGRRSTAFVSAAPCTAWT